MLECILKFIYPDRCVVCGEVMEFGSRDYICEKCAKVNKFSFDNRCSVCGRPLKERVSSEGICRSCAEEEIYFSSGLTIFPFSKVRNSVHNLKYYGGRINAEPYAEIMYDYMKSSGKISALDFDSITFVPMHPDRERKRGYNQARLIAEKLAEITGKPCEVLLEKTVLTKPQSRLTGEERMLNVKNTFAVINSSEVKGKRILIADDVLTTGSTINECSRMLMAGGAKKVMFITFAYAD